MKYNLRSFDFLDFLYNIFMYNNEKIGVGIITCNRKESFKKLYDVVCQCENVNSIVIVKNLNYNYNEADPSILAQNNTKVQYINVLERLGIAYNKNIAIKTLLDNQCQHIFIIEDDILIKDLDVFKVYIDTAKEFKLGHLNFCRSFDTLVTHTFLKPYFTVCGKNHNLDIFNRLSGDFSYFTRDAILKAGLYDERFINALDHCEHTYRMSLLGFYTPFNAFGDIASSDKYIEDTGTTTTIVHDQQYDVDVKNALNHFISLYGYPMIQIRKPTNNEILSFLRNKITYTES